jgi:hypothetical protein
MFAPLLVSVPPPSVNSSLPVLVLPVTSFLLKTGSLQAGLSENIIFNNNTITYHYNKKENLGLQWN